MTDDRGVEPPNRPAGPPGSQGPASATLSHLVRVISLVPSWLRPAVVGAVLLGGIVLVRILVSLGSIRGTVTSAAAAVGAAAGAGGAGGLAYSLTRPTLRKLGRPGDYVTGVVTVAAYMGALAVAAPYAFGESLIKDRTELSGYAVVSVVFGLLIGHKWFGPSSK